MSLRRSCAGQLLLAVVGAFGFTSIAAAAVLNFESQTHGKVVANQYRSYQGGITISADNFRAGGPDMAIVFDSRRTNTADPDLQAPFVAGNLAPGTTTVGNMLIIAENSIEANHDGLIDSPDDEGE